MITFPASKINLGLSILNRREDNYHNIQTVMYPVEGLTDVIEILKSDDSGCQFSSSGLIVDCQPHKNLCVKAYELMRTRYGLGGVKMHLHKKVPFGAGLGGGSADAAAVLNGLNDLFELHLYAEKLRSLAAELGSDIPFFIDSQSAVASSRGEVLQPVGLSLAGVNIAIENAIGIIKNCLCLICKNNFNFCTGFCDNVRIVLNIINTCKFMLVFTE